MYNNWSMLDIITIMAFLLQTEDETELKAISKKIINLENQNELIIEKLKNIEQSINNLSKV